MGNAITAQALQKILEDKINELDTEELVQLDEEGARIYILTDEDEQPYLYISYGNPDDRVFHEWPEGQDGPKACDRGWECWQEFKTMPADLRALLLHRLPDGLIDPYLLSVSECSVNEGD